MAVWKQPSLYLGVAAEMFKNLSPPAQQFISEDFYCWKHLEPRLLFCEDEQVTLCNKCYLSQDHKNHAVFGAQEAAELYRVSPPPAPEQAGARPPPPVH